MLVTFLSDVKCQLPVAPVEFSLCLCMFLDEEKKRSQLNFLLCFCLNIPLE